MEQKLFTHEVWLPGGLGYVSSQEMSHQIIAMFSGIHANDQQEGGVTRN
jgi:hypothetical protein